MAVNHLGILIVVVIVSNLDIFLVGLSYGARKINIPIGSNLLIATITGLGTLFSMLFGKTISVFLQPQLAIKIGAVIIIIVGFYILISECNKIKNRNDLLNKEYQMEADKLTFIRKTQKILDDPFLADMDYSGHISMKESLLLGWALAINNMANSLGAGMVGINPVITSSMALFISFFCILFGLKIGYGLMDSFLGRISGPISGMILIVVGIYSIFF